MEGAMAVETYANTGHTDGPVQVEGAPVDIPALPIMHPFPPTLDGQHPQQPDVNAAQLTPDAEQQGYLRHRLPGSGYKSRAGAVVSGGELRAATAAASGGVAYRGTSTCVAVGAQLRLWCFGVC